LPGAGLRRGISPDHFRKYSVLHALNGASDGVGALGVIQASDGNLYGTAGGYTSTIFRVNPSSGQYTVLHTFATGTGPSSSLIEASNGLLYGLAGITKGYLTVYPSTLNGVVQNLGQVQCGGSKASGLFVAKRLEASDGNLWGVCGAYGTNSTSGEVFSVSTSGALLTTVPFNDRDGAYPDSGVIRPRAAFSTALLLMEAPMRKEFSHWETSMLSPDFHLFLCAVEDRVSFKCRVRVPTAHRHFKTLPPKPSPSPGA